MGALDDFKAWSRREGNPVTVLLIATMSLVGLYFFASRYQGVERIVYAGMGLDRPWTLLTYPWASLMASGMGLVFFIVLMVWFFWVGKTVEQDIGSPKMLLLWLAATFAGALSNWAGVAISHRFSILYGPLIPIAVITVAWCTRYPAREIRVYGVIPVTGRWLGLIITVAVLLYFAQTVPIIGVTNCLPLLLGFAFALNRIPGMAYGSGVTFRTTEKSATTRGQVMYDQTYFDDVKRREQERADRERLKKLFGDDEPEP